jgi:hypothetical protein
LANNSTPAERAHTSLSVTAQWLCWDSQSATSLILRDGTSPTYPHPMVPNTSVNTSHVLISESHTSRTAWQAWQDRVNPIPLAVAPLALDTLVMAVLLTAVMLNGLRANEEVRTFTCLLQLPPSLLLSLLPSFSPSLVLSPSPPPPSLPCCRRTMRTSAGPEFTRREWKCRFQELEGWEVH